MTKRGWTQSWPVVRFTEVSPPGRGGPSRAVPELHGYLESSFDLCPKDTSSPKKGQAKAGQGRGLQADRLGFRPEWRLEKELICWIGNGGGSRAGQGRADSRPCRTGGAKALRNVSPSLASMVGTSSGTDWGWACEHQGPSKHDLGKIAQ